jgi:predicted SprT family Zn-dependent metalloprotease
MTLHETEALAWSHMLAHGLPQKGWKFDFQYRLNHLGTCFYFNKTIKLSVSYVLLNDEPEILDTILHEIAHALLPPKEGHGKRWKAMCVKLGCNPERCVGYGKIKRPELAYKAVCVNGHTHYRTRKTKVEITCGQCDRRFNMDYLLEFEPNPNHKKK